MDISLEMSTFSFSPKLNVGVLTCRKNGALNVRPGSKLISRRSKVPRGTLETSDPHGRPDSLHECRVLGFLGGPALLLHSRLPFGWIFALSEVAHRALLMRYSEAKNNFV